MQHLASLVFVLLMVSRNGAWSETVDQFTDFKVATSEETHHWFYEVKVKDQVIPIEKNEYHLIQLPSHSELSIVIQQMYAAIIFQTNVANLCRLLLATPIAQEDETVQKALLAVYNLFAHRRIPADSVVLILTKLKGINGTRQQLTVLFKELLNVIPSEIYNDISVLLKNINNSEFWSRFHTDAMLKLPKLTDRITDDLLAAVKGRLKLQVFNSEIAVYFGKLMDALFRSIHNADTVSSIAILQLIILHLPCKTANPESSILRRKVADIVLSIEEKSWKDIAAQMKNTSLQNSFMWLKEVLRFIAQIPNVSQVDKATILLYIEYLPNNIGETHFPPFNQSPLNPFSIIPPTGASLPVVSGAVTKPIMPVSTEWPEFPHSPNVPVQSLSPNLPHLPNSPEVPDKATSPRKPNKTDEVLQIISTVSLNNINDHILPKHPDFPRGPPASPDKPGSQFSPSTPDKPYSPSSGVPPRKPNRPNKPGSPLSPNHPGKPYTSNSPDSPELPGGSTVPLKPGSPYSPSSPKKPHSPDSPVSPDFHGHPDLPDKPGSAYSPSSPKKPHSPASPDFPGHPDLPDKPVSPHSVSSPDIPHSPASPVLPEQSTLPDKPKVPVSPNNLKRPQSPDSQFLPHLPGKPNLPDKPKAPSNPNNPNAPVSPELPRNATIPEKPKSPISPVAPNTPSSPDLPYKPNMPDKPSKPLSPDSPDTPRHPTKPSAPSKPTTSGLPGHPVQPDKPHKPFSPSNPDIPDLPKQPILPDKPSLPLSPGSPDAPGLPGHPVQPDKPHKPFSPSNPDIPDLPKQPILPDKPSLPLSPSSPDAPGLPGHPVQPDKPYKPFSPSNPDIPHLPKQPILPDKPSLPLSPSSPEAPDLPRQPNLPRPPTLPNNPSAPLSPSSPATPDLPRQPDLPGQPDLPSQPVLPKLPTLADKPFAPHSPSLPAAPALPVQPELPRQPALSEKPDLPKLPTVPVKPFAPLSPDVPVTPDLAGKPELPRQPSIPIKPSTPLSPSKPASPNVPTQSAKPIAPLSPIIPTTPDSPRQPILPDKPQDPVSPNGPNTLINPTSSDKPNKTILLDKPSVPSSTNSLVSPEVPIKLEISDKPSGSPDRPHSPDPPSEPSASFSPSSPGSPASPDFSSDSYISDAPDTLNDVTSPTFPRQPTFPNHMIEPETPYSPNVPKFQSYDRVIVQSNLPHLLERPRGPYNAYPLYLPHQNFEPQPHFPSSVPKKPNFSEIFRQPVPPKLIYRPYFPSNSHEEDQPNFSQQITLSNKIVESKFPEWLVRPTAPLQGSQSWSPYSSKIHYSSYEVNSPNFPDYAPSLPYMSSDSVPPMKESQPKLLKFVYPLSSTTQTGSVTQLIPQKTKYMGNKHLLGFGDETFLPGLIVFPGAYSSTTFQKMLNRPVHSVEVFKKHKGIAPSKFPKNPLTTHLSHYDGQKLEDSVNQQSGLNSVSGTAILVGVQHRPKHFNRYVYANDKEAGAYASKGSSKYDAVEITDKDTTLANKHIFRRPSQKILLSHFHNQVPPKKHLYILHGRKYAPTFGVSMETPAWSIIRFRPSFNTNLTVKPEMTMEAPKVYSEYKKGLRDASAEVTSSHWLGSSNACFSAGAASWTPGVSLKTSPPRYSTGYLPPSYENERFPPSASDFHEPHRLIPLCNIQSYHCRKMMSIRSLLQTAMAKNIAAQLPRNAFRTRRSLLRFILIFLLRNKLVDSEMSDLLRCYLSDIKIEPYVDAAPGLHVHMNG